MNRLVLFTLVLVFAATSKHAEGHSIGLNKVMRELDVLYKRQGPTGTPPPSQPPPSPTPDSSGSGEIGSGGGSEEEGGCDTRLHHIYTFLQVIDSRSFVKDIREAISSVTGVCSQMFDWLEHHDDEKAAADESQGLDTIVSPTGGTPGPTGPPKRTASLAEVKRSLRKLQKRMKGKGKDEDDDVELELFDMSIPWHKIFLTCLAWETMSEMGL